MIATRPQNTEEKVSSRLLTERAKAQFSTFFQLYPPNKPYIYGRHTLDKLRRIDSIMAQFAAGKSSYTIFEEPPRHGKSDISSKRLPAWFHMRFPSEDVIIAGNTYDLAKSLSDDCRKILAEVGGVWGSHPAKNTWAIDRWQMEGNRGIVTAIGVGGTIMGRGGALIDIDDPYEDREQVESETERQKVKDWFRSVIMTRRAPVHAIIINMQRWHVDDLVGWIKRKNDPTSSEYDADFPRFTVIKYPAQSPNFITPTNPSGWLFPERFPDEFYRATKALDAYSWASQYMQDPEVKGGAVFPVRIEGQDADPTVRIVDKLPEGFYEWGWDLASSARQLSKENPDFTAGVKAAIIDGHLCIKFATQFQHLAGERNKIILNYARQDGSDTRLHIETVAGYKDAYEEIRVELLGEVSVMRSTPHHDKRSRAEGALSPYFEAKRVLLERGAWNEMWIKQFRDFRGLDDGSKDDIVDATVLAIDEQRTKRSGTPLIQTPLNALKIKYRPSVFMGRNDKVRKRFLGVPRLKIPDWEAMYEPEGSLLRGIHLGKREGSASVLLFADKSGGIHEISTVCALPGHGTSADFARQVLVQTYDPTPGYRRHLPVELDLITSDDHEEVQYAFEELLDTENSRLLWPSNYPIPMWVKLAEVDGPAGMEVIEAKAAATCEGRGDGLYIWSPEVLTALRDARTRPQPVGREGLTGREELEIGPIIRAMKLALAKWRR